MSITDDNFVNGKRSVILAFEDLAWFRSYKLEVDGN